MAIDVLLLAAGFGTRLRPLTDEIPKSLLPVCGIPLIQWRIDQLFAQATAAKFSLSNLTINCFHLAQPMARFIAAHPATDRLTAVIEPEILGTGGAIVNARHLLTTDPSLVLNGDTISELPLAAAIDFHRSHRFLATLVLSPHDLHRNVFVSGEGVRQIDTTGTSPEGFTYTGACLFSPALFDLLPSAGYYDLRDVFIALISRRRLGAFITTGSAPLLDIGTPDRYLGAHRECQAHFGDYLASHPIYPYRRHRQLGGDFGYIAPDARIDRSAEIRNSVIMSGAEIGPDGVVDTAIIGPGVKINSPTLKTMVSKMGRVAL